MVQFADRTDLKSHLNITSSVNDGELDLILLAAEDVVVGLVPDTVLQSYVEVVEPVGATVLLRHRPVVSATVTDPAGTTVDGFLLDAEIGVLRGVGAYGPLTVSYTAGAGQIPAAVTLATLIIAGHLWETQRGAAPSQVLQGDVPDYQPGLGFAIPNRARELLAPFVRTGMIA